MSKKSEKRNKKTPKISSKKTSKKYKKKFKTEKKKAKKINENYEQLSKKYAILEEKYEYLKKVCMTYKIAQEETKANAKHLSPRARKYYNDLLSKVNIEKPPQKPHEERSLLDSSYHSNSLDGSFVNSLQTKLAATKSKNESSIIPGSLDIESSITDNDENTIYASGYLNSNNSSNKTESYMTNEHN